jgi:hypothetical protein
MALTLSPRLLVVALLAVACAEPAAAPRALDLSGLWVGANDVAALELRLDNATFTAPCPNFGCSGSYVVEQIKLQGTYRNLRSGESIELSSETQRRPDGIVSFTLYMKDNGVSPLDTITYATTRLVGQAVDASTIDARLLTDYQRSSGGSSVSWTTWTADISTLTLRRR